MKKQKLSIVLATYNEEKNIGKCLESVKDLADEIIVVDGESTDNTVKIAKKYGAKVIVKSNEPIFHINKQISIDSAKGDWIFQLDADEAVSKKLAKEIIKIIQMTNLEICQRKIDLKKKKLFRKHQNLLEKRDGKYGSENEEIVAFFIPRRNVFLDKVLKFGGTYPDGVIRLIKNTKAHFPCKSVHEQIRIDGGVSWLENDLLHYTAPTFSRYITNANRYTSLTATELERKSVGINVISVINYLIIKPTKTFILIFIRHKGFMDGFEGFVFALFSGLHWSIAFLKLWEKIYTKSTIKS